MLNRRSAASLAFLFHLLMVLVLPVLHVAAESETLRHVPHLEAQNDAAPCPASHEAACATCRVLHHTAVLTVAERLAATAVVTAEPRLAAHDVVVPHPTPHGALGSRAPPLA